MSEGMSLIFHDFIELYLVHNYMIFESGCLSGPGR